MNPIGFRLSLSALALGLWKKLIIMIVVLIWIIKIINKVNELS